MAFLATSSTKCHDQQDPIMAARWRWRESPRWRAPGRRRRTILRRRPSYRPHAVAVVVTAMRPRRRPMTWEHVHELGRVRTRRPRQYSSSRPCQACGGESDQDGEKLDERAHGGQKRLFSAIWPPEFIRKLKPGAQLLSDFGEQKL